MTSMREPIDLTRAGPGSVKRTRSQLVEAVWIMVEFFLVSNPLQVSSGVRAWALLFNHRPWHPTAVRANGGWRCPAERLNKHRYHDDWLQNLLASASLGGYRRRIAPPQNP